MRVLITGGAGFIGYHLARGLLEEGRVVAAIDAFTPYYDVKLKHDRAARLQKFDDFSLHRIDILDGDALEQVFTHFQPHIVVHLAAQVGVRYSLEQPRAYVDTNIVGSFNIIDQARRSKVQHLLMASTSSAYGASQRFPFHETDRAAHPLTIYAASKRAGELMAHSHAHLYGVPTTMLRFFSVYGPWGRPDMAPFLFTDRIFRGVPIDVYNHGHVARDFTCIDDLAHAIRLLINTPPVQGKPVCTQDSLSPVAPHRIVNIGHAEPVQLMDFIHAIEASVGKSATMNMMDMQPGDVEQTFADPSLLKALTGFTPVTDIGQGMARFVDWYRAYYRSA